MLECHCSPFSHRTKKLISHFRLEERTPTHMRVKLKVRWRRAGSTWWWQFRKTASATVGEIAMMAKACERAHREKNKD